MWILTTAQTQKIPNILSTDNLLVFILSIISYILVRRWWDQQKDFKKEQDDLKEEYKRTSKDIYEQLKDINQNISARIDALEKNNQEVQASQREILLNAKNRAEELIERFKETERSLREYSKESQDRLMHEVEGLKREIVSVQKTTTNIKQENESISNDISYLMGRLGSPRSPEDRTLGKYQGAIEIQGDEKT